MTVLTHEKREKGNQERNHIMKKIISILLALMIICVTVISAGAVYTQSHYYNVITGYDCNCYLAYNNSHGSNSCVAQTNIVKLFGESDQMVMAGVQLVVEYTDGTYDIDFMTDNGYSNWSLVSAYIEVPQGKVVLDVIGEHHLFWNYSYIDTKTTSLYFGDNIYN